ncbi:helix-turn-helix domain-containing protein [Streptomyces rhizosphaericus]|uniref:Helix-turn-helix domain-containing protein n=1 Tax=Streptomyces rhizosphaericus TaxID=114699 RepID=A0A6G4AG21_9ACTN|nr:helix-turn-helix transcriptional regulator [Streptomyces rhizosphaericus]NEW71764.1 helix-turn-helix domain-containing protein [Streptomyces rhizosphaericus]
MTESPTAAVQAARRQLAARLREIRTEAGLTATELARRLDWYPSKVSRIEHARTPPAIADIRVWCAACGADNAVDDLVASAQSADSMYMEWRQLQKTGLRHLQESRAELYDRTRLFRVYCSTVIPGLLQTPAYAAALLESISRFHSTPNDVAEAVEARMKRSRVLYTNGNRFSVLVEESVLRYQIGDSETMAGQLGYLLTLMSLPSVSLGVIPFSAPRPTWPLETFNVFDDARVHVELLSAAVKITAPSEVEQYVRASKTMAGMAVYGSAARELITEAITHLG